MIYFLTIQDLFKNPKKEQFKNDAEANALLGISLNNE